MPVSCLIMWNILDRLGIYRKPINLGVVERGTEGAGHIGLGLSVSLFARNLFGGWETKKPLMIGSYFICAICSKNKWACIFSSAGLAVQELCLS